MRRFKENIILKYFEKYMMLNLISFRRKVILENEYEILKKIDAKNYENLDINEQLYMKLLYEEKQLLSNDLITWYDAQRDLNFNKPCYRIGSATINLSYDCNFKCKYCYQKNFNYNGKYLELKDIDKIYNYITDYNKLHNAPVLPEEVIISGGEPLLDKNIESINYICDKFCGCNFKLFTNGTNILKYSNKIDFVKFNEIQVSLDGIDEVIRELNKNNNSSFDIICDGILYLLDKGIKVNIISMVTDDSLPFIEKFLQLLEEKNIVQNDLFMLRFSFVVAYDSKYTLDPDFYSPEKYLAMRKEVLNKVRCFGKKNVSVDILYDLVYFAKNALRSQNTRTEGRISTCNNAKGIPALFGPDHGIYWCACTNLANKLGNFDDSPEKLDKNHLLHELLNRNIYRVEKCKKCFYRFVCSSGCPLYVLNCNDKVYDFHCGIFGHPLFEEQIESFLGM